jgi:type IV pilus assembly protein PilC
MSGFAEDSPFYQKPPRRARKPDPPADPEPESLADEPSTFRPNPKRSQRPAASGPASSPPPTEADDASTFQSRPGRSSKGKSRGRDAETGIRDVDPGRGPGLWERIFFGRVGTGQLATFCRQFAAYMNAGVDIGKSLSNLERQFKMTALGPVIGRLLVSVRRGDTFAAACARETGAFDALFLGMIKAAEARGGLPETLRMMGRHYEARQSLMRQARSAMIYPIIVVMLASLVAAGMSIWILPMFGNMLKEMAGDTASLPLPSRMLLAFSDFIQHSGWLIFPVVLVGTPLALFQTYKTKSGKAMMDRMLLWVPVFGQLARKIDTSRFARTLSALLNAGVDMGSSLNLTADVLHLDPYRRAIRKVRVDVVNGTELSAALDSTRRFGSDVIAVVESGEETGKLPETLDHLADDYEEQVAYMVRNMGQLVQPLLMVVMGLFVLFIILAVFLPYLSILTNLSNPH